MEQELLRTRKNDSPIRSQDPGRVDKSGFQEGMAMEKLAGTLGRSSGAIVAEIIRQDLVPPDLR